VMHFTVNKIDQLEEEQSEWLKLIREQAIVVRSTLEYVNQTLHHVLANELNLIWELHKILQYINVGNWK
jgi:hypothetical protein